MLAVQERARRLRSIPLALGFMCHRGHVLAKRAFAAYLSPSLTRLYPFPTGEEGLWPTLDMSLNVPSKLC